MKTTSELNMTKSPKDAHTTFNVKRKNYINYQGKRRAESDRITHRCPHFAAPAALKIGEIQRQPRHIESFLQWKAEFRAKLLLKPGNSEKSKAKASAHIHHWGKKVEKKAEHAYIYVKENCWVLPHSTDAAGRDFKNQMQWRVYTQDIPKQEAKMHKWSPDIKGIRKWLKKQRKTVQNKGEAK